MMDLDPSERYAAAALFTLALHTTQIEAGVDETGAHLAEQKAAWGWVPAACVRPVRSNGR